MSEVNSDVPGGFIEASGFASAMAARFPGAAMTGDPVAALAEAWRETLPPGARVGLVHATAYTDDRQVMEQRVAKAVEDMCAIPSPIPGQERGMTKPCRDEAWTNARSQMDGAIRRAIGS